MSKAENVLAAKLRNEFGDNASRRLRKSGFTPAVIYSRGKEAAALTIKTDDWLVAANSGSRLFVLDIEGKEVHAMVKEVQFNHLKNFVYHVDFQEIDMNAEVIVSIPVHAFGDCYGASHGGVLEQEVHELTISCRPADMPDAIRADVTKLGVGEALTIGQIELPAGVKIHGMNLEEVAFHVVLPTEEAEAPAAVEGEAAAQPEAINEKKTEARAAEKEEKAKK